MSSGMNNICLLNKLHKMSLQRVQFLIGHLVIPAAAAGIYHFTV